jgi:predicted metalloendopeptidase
MQLSNLEEFQAFYDIDEKDDMHLPKDLMVSIW